MLIVMYKPNSDTAVADGKIKQLAEKWIDEMPLGSNQYVCTSQMLMIDAVRAVLVEKNIPPEHVVFEVYNDTHEFVESVSITDNYSLTSWEAFREDMMNFLKTVMGAKKYGTTK